MFDVRFLPNPFYIEDLRYKTGNDHEVYDYVMSFDETKEFEEITKLIDLPDIFNPLTKTLGAAVPIKLSSISLPKATTLFNNSKKLS